MDSKLVKAAAKWNKLSTAAKLTMLTRVYPGERWAPLRETMSGDFFTLTALQQDGVCELLKIK